VERSDRGLGLELPDPGAGQGVLEDLDALGDQSGVPAAAVLLREGHETAVRAGTRGSAGVVQQHQGEQPGDLLVVDDGSQLAGQSDGLRGQVHIAAVPLVEHEVQDAKHRGDVTGLVETDVGDGLLGTTDPLAMVASGTRYACAI
jgi:hypothetical protein